MMCKWDEAYTEKEMLEETGYCKECKLKCNNSGKERKDDWEPICETCKNWDGIKNQCRINRQKVIDCWENPFDRD